MIVKLVAPRPGCIGVTISKMAVLHISEAELVRDLHAVLERVQQGSEVVVEQERRPVAVMSPIRARAATMSEIIAAMEAGGACGVVDEDIARDVEQGIADRNVPWAPPT